jgi:hypothetical protein
MTTTPTSPRLTAVFGSTVLAACVQASTPASEDKQQASSEAAAPVEPAPAPAPAPEAKPPGDRAYVSVDGVGLHVLDNDGWRLLLETRSPIRDMLMLDGQLFVLSSFGVQRVSAEGQTEDVAALDGPTYGEIGEPLALAGADGKTFWIAGAQGVARHSGSWQLTPVPTTNFANVDLALDRAGQPWLVMGSLFRHHEDRWQSVALESGNEPLALVADPRNEAMFVHAGCEGGLCRLLRVNADEAPTQYSAPAGDCTEYSRMAVSSDSAQLAIAGRCGVVRVNLEGDDEAKPFGGQPYQLGLEGGWPGQPLRGLVYDAGGRLWATTNNSLLIAAFGGVEEYPVSQLGDIAGSVNAILIVGEGPPAPTLGPVRTGGLAGTIVVLDGTAKRPVADARLELCNRLPPGGEISASSPCAGVEGVHATTTDSEGRFEVTNIPIDHYYLGVELDGRWVRAQPKALNMRAGMTGNVGKIVVQK